MQVKREQSQEKVIQDLQRQVAELTAENLLLQDQLERKEQFTAMIAHELRGPLSPIINYAQMLSRHRCKPAEGQTEEGQKPQATAIQRHTRIIVSQARRMSRLVNDLLDASRLSSGQFTLACDDCDIVALTQEIVEQLRPVAPYHTLIVKAPAGEKKLCGPWDGGRLQQVLGNLLDNAIKYSDEHTTITVSISAIEDRVRVSVHNQGASIPSTDIGQLFRPYMRLPATSNRQGSGLGLHIAKSIIDAHGGLLRLEPHSEEGGDANAQGTTFTFELPLHRETGKEIFN